MGDVCKETFAHSACLAEYSVAVCAYSCTIIHKTHGQHQQYYDDYQYSVTDIFGRAFVSQLLLGKIYALLLASSFDGDTDVVYAVALFHVYNAVL